jgi:hypothetical protein
MPKWKDPRTSNVEMHVQVDVGGVGVRESIELGWSQRFGLDKLMSNMSVDDELTFNW